jgi:hypothetical protein
LGRERDIRVIRVMIGLIKEMMLTRGILTLKKKSTPTKSPQQKKITPTNNLTKKTNPTPAENLTTTK